MHQRFSKVFFCSAYRRLKRKPSPGLHSPNRSQGRCDTQGGWRYLNKAGVVGVIVELVELVELALFLSCHLSCFVSWFLLLVTKSIMVLVTIAVLVVVVKQTYFSIDRWRRLFKRSQQPATAKEIRWAVEADNFVSRGTVDGRKSCTTKDDNYLIIYRVLTIPGGAGFLPSTGNTKQTCLSYFMCVAFILFILLMEEIGLTSWG